MFFDQCTLIMNEEKIKFCGIGINILTITDFVNIIERKIIDRDEIIVQTGVNAYTIVCIQKDEILRETINKSSLVNVDGMAVAWALKFLGYKYVSKVSCPDIFEELIKLAAEKNYRPFFLGTTPEILEKTINNLKLEYPNLQIAGSHHGFFDEDESEYIAEIVKNSKADMLFLGMTSPKKELFSEKFADYMQIPYIFGVGGVFDIVAGQIKRAPRWIQKTGFEWLHRFIQEPRRMWRRYLIGNVKFIWIVIKQKIRKGKSL